MAHAFANPEDILVAYSPDTVTLGNQAHSLEVTDKARAVSSPAPPGAFLEMAGGSDTHYEDFTSSLRDFVSARRSAATAAITEGGSTLVGGWFGGTGADPSAVVLGIDWLAGDEAAREAAPAGEAWRASGDVDGEPSSFIVSASAAPPVQEEAASQPSDGGILSLIIDTSDAGESESVDRGRAEPPYTPPRFRESAESAAAVELGEAAPQRAIRKASLAPVEASARKNLAAQRLKIDNLRAFVTDKRPDSETEKGSASPGEARQTDKSGGPAWDFDLDKLRDGELAALASGGSS